MGKLTGKVAIITGGVQGMGAADAKLFVDEGAKVVITTDSKVTEGQKLADELGDNAIFIQQDVSSEADWKKVIKTTLDQFGRLDILVNNAGIDNFKSLFDITADNYLKIIKVNQLGTFLGIKYAAAEMKQHGGSIINISSIAGLVGALPVYTDTKFAVRGMTKSAAVELGHYNIRVNSVHPGAVRTPMLDDPAVAKVLEAGIAKTPLQRVAEPEEVAKMVLFLASDDSSFSTGSEFVLDGGATAQ